MSPIPAYTLLLSKRAGILTSIIKRAATSLPDVAARAESLPIIIVYYNAVY